MSPRTRRPRKPSKPKTLQQRSLLGQQGINLIEQIALKMGYPWTPSNSLETGIDGIIEIRDPVTGETTNSIIQVQSKATDKEFQGETDSSLDYYCSERDLDYWLRGNAPVILVHSRPRTNEAYWVSIKDYFKDPEKLRSKKITFSKTQNRFDENVATVLKDIAIPRDSGIYFSPPPKTEKLYTNLVRVTFPEKLYVAETGYRKAGEIFAVLGDQGIHIGSDWFLMAKSIIAFHKLDEHPWNLICNAGTCESFDTKDWADSDDPDKYRTFVRLLNQNLQQLAWEQGVKYDNKLNLFYFRATKDLRPKRVRYPSFKEETSRFVFRGYQKKGDPNTILNYRHSAFKRRFVRHDGQWYLEITPTYYFTWDGKQIDEFYENKLKKMKILERNLAVIGQVFMWAHYLNRKNLLTPDNFLVFHELVTFDFDFGIPDQDWLPKEDEETRKKLTTVEATLFDQ